VDKHLLILSTSFWYNPHVFNFFGFGQKTYLGIDIGTASIKIAELSKEKGRPKLENYAILESYKFLDVLTDDSAMTNRSRRVFGGEATEMIKRLIGKANIAVKETNMAVPIFSSFLTVMDLPMMNETELAQAVQFEARKYVPVSLEQLVIDWNLIGQTPPTANDQGHLQVLLVAIPRELIDEYVDTARNTGLAVSAIELETVSATRALMGSDPTPTVILDVGARDTTISIVDQGFLRISHSIETSSEDLTRVLSKALNISLRRAEELKRERGVAVIREESEVASVILPLLDIISSSIQQIIDLHHSKTQRKIEKLIMYGGAANMPGLAEYFSKKLKIDITYANPFSRIIYPQKLEPIIKKIGSELAIALGLALRDMQ